MSTYTVKIKQVKSRLDLFPYKVDIYYNDSKYPLKTGHTITVIGAKLYARNRIKWLERRESAYKDIAEYEVNT